MDGTSLAVLAGVVILALVALVIAIGLLLVGFSGALVLFAFAALQGFLGIAAYFAAWVVLFPVMAVASIVVGFLASQKPESLSSVRNEKPKSKPEAQWAAKTDRTPPTDPEEHYKWANRLPPYDIPPPDSPEELQKWAKMLPPYDK